MGRGQSHSRCAKIGTARRLFRVQATRLHLSVSLFFVIKTSNRSPYSCFQRAGGHGRGSIYDFPGDAQCGAIPYGIYDVVGNRGHVCVGTSADTSEFAVRSIRDWWKHGGRKRYPKAKELLISADGGGSNGYRPRLWKRELQRWADDDRLAITVCHYPRAASKCNDVEHRLFGPITNNWAGQPLRSLDLMLNAIRGTTTNGGLRVTSRLDQRTYPKKTKVTDQEMRELNLHRHTICPDWNYTIKPRTTSRK